MGNTFELRTNHRGLKYLFAYQTLTARQTRWPKFLSEYDFDIKYIKVKENKFVMHLVEKYKECMLQPLACANQI